MLPIISIAQTNHSSGFDRTSSEQQNDHDYNDDDDTRILGRSSPSREFTFAFLAYPDAFHPGVPSAPNHTLHTGTETEEEEEEHERNNKPQNRTGVVTFLLPTDASLHRKITVSPFERSSSTRIPSPVAHLPI